MKQLDLHLNVKASASLAKQANQEKHETPDKPISEILNDATAVRDNSDSSKKSSS
jgi:hypothetical protein